MEASTQPPPTYGHVWQPVPRPPSSLAAILTLCVAVAILAVLLASAIKGHIDQTSARNDANHCITRNSIAGSISYEAIDACVNAARVGYYVDNSGFGS